MVGSLAGIAYPAVCYETGLTFASSVTQKNFFKDLRKMKGLVKRLMVEVNFFSGHRPRKDRQFLTHPQSRSSGCGKLSWIMLIH